MLDFGFGTWCMLPSSFVADVISSTKIDFLIIDMEHGTMTYETAEDMVRAAQLKKLSTNNKGWKILFCML